MDHAKTTSDRESERRYQHQFEASRRAEQRAMHLLDFVPYPMVIFKLEESAAVPFAKARKSVIIRAGPFLPFSSLAKLDQNRIRAIIDKIQTLFLSGTPGRRELLQWKSLLYINDGIP